ncbi:MAG: pilin [Candidatus Paceibacterota bacterium]
MILSLKIKHFTTFTAILFLFLSIIVPITTAMADDPAAEEGLQVCNYGECKSIVCCGNGDPILNGQPNPAYKPCTFNDIFCTINRIVHFILFEIVPALALIWFAIAGFTIITAAGDPGKVTQGRQMITYAVIGLLVVFTAWILVYEFVGFIGGADQKEWLLQFFKKP